ncbi:hypothetical protein DL95DRAFT_415240 [Leptodontidium sp. 2 PMI_412]|nr:hypothetical protein DL95DRAFT_415240 [Leptodontidium sp. 2 PMI_412]
MAARKVAIITGAAGTEEQLGPNSLFVRCDVSDWQSQADLFKKAYAWGGRVDLLAANAGIPDSQSVYALPGENAEPSKPDLKTLEVDLHSVFYGLQLLRYYVRKGKNAEGGKMIVTASQAGFYPLHVGPMYCAAKHGVIGLVRAAAPKIFEDEHIALNAVCPGPVDTNINPDFHKVVPIDLFTPMEVVLGAFDKCIDEDITGQAIECSNKSFYLRDHIGFKDDASRTLVEDMAKNYDKMLAQMTA